MDLVEVTARDCLHLVAKEVMKHIFAVLREPWFPPLLDQVKQNRILHAQPHEDLNKLLESPRNLAYAFLKAVLIKNGKLISVHPSQNATNG